MEYTRLGSTGLVVSKLCLGTWRFGQETDGVLETDRETAFDLLDRFAEAGGNYIDCANNYGGGDSPRWLGEWLDERDREDFVITSKCYWTMESRFGENLSRKNVRAEVQGDLDRIGTDYIDIYYIHRWDEDTPIVETLRTLNEFVREGKIRYLAASSMAAWQLTKALWKSDVEGLERFEVTQPRFNAAYREPVGEYLDVCADQGLAVCPWSPLEAGFLTGKYDREATQPEGSRGDLQDWDDHWEDRQWETLDAIRTVAEEEAATPAQVSLRWLMDQREFTCVPIMGARTVAQLEDNLGAVDVDLSEAQFDRIEAAY